MRPPPGATEVSFGRRNQEGGARIGLHRWFARRFGERLLERGFTAQQASKLTSCTNHQLRYWDRVGLVSPAIQQTGGRPGVRRLYSFRDLVALRVVRSLLDHGMSLQRVRRAWAYLRRNANLDSHLSEEKLITDGHTVFQITRNEGQLLDALRSGQLVFFIAIDHITRHVAEDVTHFELDRDQFLDVLRRVEVDVIEERRVVVS